MENAIEIKEINKKFGDVDAVRNLNLGIKKGELFGLLGVNGAGKTTTIKMISCLIKPTSGDITILNHSVVNEPDFAKKIVNVSPQETAVAPKLSVYENLEFIAELYGESKNAVKQKIMDTASLLGLEEVLKRKAGTLSGGWQRRLSIAMALITDPQILILDEPTLGLDVLARRELWNIIKSLHGKVTIILTTHYLEEAEALCDRIAIMAKGVLKSCGTVAELKVIGNSDNFEDAFINIATKEGVK